jgi:hypothetical protein
MISVTQGGLIDEKKQGSKISRYCPLNEESATKEEERKNVREGNEEIKNAEMKEE